MMTNTLSEMAQVRVVDLVFCYSSVEEHFFFLFFIKLHSKLDELSRLKESEYVTSKTVNIFQYFDKIYTVCHGTAQFPILIDTLIQKKYPRNLFCLFSKRI